MFTSNRAIVQRRGSASLFLLGARVHPAVGPSHSHLLSVTTCRSYAASVSDDGTRRRSMWLLKELREVTEASITDVRAAIQQCGENKGACIAYLQECGAAKALVKNTREARQGVVLAGTIPDVCAYCIEVGTETDFAARSEKFLKYCAAIGSCVQSIASQCALVCGSEAMEAFLVSAIEDQTKDIHSATTAAISERIGVRKVRVLTWPIDAPRPLKVGSGKHQCKLFLEGKPLEDFTEYHFGSYAHSLSPIEYPSSSPVRVGTVVALSSLSLPFSQRPVESELLDRTLRSLAQHIVATAGMYGEDLTQRGEGVALHKSTVVPLSEQKYLGDGEQISEWVSKQLGSKARVVQGLLVRVGE